MRASEFSLRRAGRIAVFAGAVLLAASLAPTLSFGCPEGGGACACGAACPNEHGGDCKAAEGTAAGGCQDKGADAKACACDHDKDGKCACGADCPEKSGGKWETTFQWANPPKRAEGR